jgi:hypothetical protein
MLNCLQPARNLIANVEREQYPELEKHMIGRLTHFCAENNIYLYREIPILMEG